jgi:hypothetical protein
MNQLWSPNPCNSFVILAVSGPVKPTFGQQNVRKNLGGAGFGLGTFCVLVIHFYSKTHVFDHVPNFLVGEAWCGEVAIDEEGVGDIQG